MAKLKYNICEFPVNNQFNQIFVFHKQQQTSLLDTSHSKHSRLFHPSFYQLTNQTYGIIVLPPLYVSFCFDYQNRREKKPFLFFFVVFQQKTYGGSDRT